MNSFTQHSFCELFGVFVVQVGDDRPIDGGSSPTAEPAVPDQQQSLAEEFLKAIKDRYDPIVYQEFVALLEVPRIPLLVHLYQMLRCYCRTS